MADTYNKLVEKLMLHCTVCKTQSSLSTPIYVQLCAGFCLFKRLYMWRLYVFSISATTGGKTAARSHDTSIPPSTLHWQENHFPLTLTPLHVLFTSLKASPAPPPPIS